MYKAHIASKKLKHLVINYFETLLNVSNINKMYFSCNKILFYGKWSAHGYYNVQTDSGYVVLGNRHLCERLVATHIGL